MLLFSKIGRLSMEHTAIHTLPFNPSILAIPSKIITVHAVGSSNNFLSTNDMKPGNCTPQIVETISDEDESVVKFELYASRNTQIPKDRTKDIEKDPSWQHEENENFQLSYASLHNFSNHEGNEYSTRVREEDISLTGVMQYPAASGSSTSCLPAPQMWHSPEEQDENYPVLRQTSDENSIGSEQQQYFNNGEPAWDILKDDETLSRCYATRGNIVLDSIRPELAPHIVLTPAEESWDDQCVAWGNRVDPQWVGNLMVPIIHTPWPLPLDSFPNPPTYIDYTPSEGNIPNLAAVFSASKFNAFIESASTERLVLCQLIMTLQKQQCRTVFFRASITARSFRERYDTSLDCFKSLEPPFVWRDPAEPILIICSKLLGTTIIDSPCPFILPHIIINTPPPQDFWVQWNNATTDPQDQGFGRYLVVPSATAGIINAAEVSGWGSPSSVCFDDTVDHSGSPPTPGSSLPDTPVDECDDLDYFLTRHGDIGDAGMETESYYQSLRNLPPIQEEFLKNEGTKLPSRPIFTIEEDDDDLPPLDDWYQ